MFYLFPDKKISPELEKECIKANISVYNNLAVCILANARDNSISNADQEYEKVVKYAGMVYKKSNIFRLPMASPLPDTKN